MANGVITYVPSPSYFKSYFHAQSDSQYSHYYTDAPFNADSLHWSEFYEYYHADFKDYIYTFESVEDLRSKLTADDIDPKQSRSRGKILMADIANKSLGLWSKLIKF